MSEELIPEAIRKPPFANYDIVVYFGAGLFFVPFANRYVVQPLGISWPAFNVEVGSEIAKEAVSILSLLFFIYITGHLLAYISSQIIEKMVDRILGKVSTAILLSSASPQRLRDKAIRTLIINRVSKIKRQRRIIDTIVRGLFHIPMIVPYAIVFALGLFGYFETRVPYSIVQAARRKIGILGLPGLHIGLKSKWYKPLEYFVINRLPYAVPRMYNYLIISGLFRSLSLIFLFGSWMVIIDYIHFRYDGHWNLSPMLGEKYGHEGLLEYGLMAMLYLFSLFSYVKFQRRYAEEAIFAFSFGEAD